MEDQMVRAIPFGKLGKIWAQAGVHDGLRLKAMQFFYSFSLSQLICILIL